MRAGFLTATLVTAFAAAPAGARLQALKLPGLMQADRA